MACIVIQSDSLSLPYLGFFPAHFASVTFPLPLFSACSPYFVSLTGQSPCQWRVAHWPGHSTAAWWKAARQWRKGRCGRTKKRWRLRPELLVRSAQGRLYVWNRLVPTSPQRDHTGCYSQRVMRVLFGEKSERKVRKIMVGKEKESGRYIQAD